MTVEDIYLKVLSMIEEYDENSDGYTSDEDIRTKIIPIINQKQTELSRIRKIYKNFEYEVNLENESKLKVSLNDLSSSLGRSIYQLSEIDDVEYELRDNTVIFKENGTADIYCSVYPLEITEDNQDDYEFELDKACLEVLPYGVAGDLLRSDISNQFGNKYTEEYQRLLNALDTRVETESYFISGGYDI